VILLSLLAGWLNGSDGAGDTPQFIGPGRGTEGRTTATGGGCKLARVPTMDVRDRAISEDAKARVLYSISSNTI
jgi:hypothetical protein